MNEIIEKIANREKLISSLLKKFSESSRRFNGLGIAADSVVNNESPANTRKMLNTALNILKDQMDINKELIALMIMFCSNDDFISQQAKFAMKVGQDPQDVLKEMFRKKMAGEF